MSKTLFRLVLATAAMAGFNGVSAAASADPSVQQAMYSEGQSKLDAGQRIQDARESVDGAKSDVVDARNQLAALDRGDYSDIVIVADGEVSKCGTPSSYPGCQPLTAADKSDAKLEAKKTLSNAESELASAQSDLAEIEKTKSADAR